LSDAGSGDRAPTSAHDAIRASFRRFRLVFLAGLLTLSLLAVEAPGVAAKGRWGGGQRTEAQRIVNHARSHIGRRFRLGTEGPRTFDCSGLVFRVYKEAGLLNRVGGSRRLAAGYYRYFKQRGKASRSNPKVGDLVVWRKNGSRRISHIGIYVGSGRVISALVNPWGVRRTTIRGLRGQRVVAYLHVNVKR
jgi:cell wall-associated NlpC family hydrolase